MPDFGFQVERIDGTTHFVYAIPEHIGDYSKKIGVVNYPGSGDQPDKSKKYQACYENRSLGHFGSVTEAANAILEQHREDRAVLSLLTSLHKP